MNISLRSRSLQLPAPLSLALVAFVSVAASPNPAIASIGPDYRRPDVAVPVAWKVAAGSSSASSLRGDWWSLFNDAVLDDLEVRALSANQNLHAAAARLDQARAAAGLARSSYFPSIGAHTSVVRERT